MELIAEFEKCPVCEVDAWLMKSIIQAEIALGNMGDDVVPNTIAKIFSNVDMRKPPLVGGRIPSARVHYDICTKCGVERPVRIERGHMTIPAGPNVVSEFT